jgi:hypothetical protein
VHGRYIRLEMSLVEVTVKGVTSVEVTVSALPTSPYSTSVMGMSLLSLLLEGENWCALHQPSHHIPYNYSVTHVLVVSLMRLTGYYSTRNTVILSRLCESKAHILL